jgi:hypothetical protein
VQARISVGRMPDRAIRHLGRGGGDGGPTVPLPADGGTSYRSSALRELLARAAARVYLSSAVPRWMRASSMVVARAQQAARCYLDKQSQENPLRQRFH